MKKATFLISLVSILFFSCQDGSTTGEKPQEKGKSASPELVENETDPVPPGPFINLDSANKMLLSYLNSINYTQNDSDLRSIIIDANALRAYLNSEQGQNITKMKLMFAHTLDYINNGGQNQNAGYRSGELTLILAGYSGAGNYIYYTGNKVLDHGTPCPTICPTSGTAVSDTLPK